MRLGMDPKTTKSLIDAMAVVLIENTKRIAQTNIAGPDGKPMSGKAAAEVVQGKLEEWRKATS